MSEVLIVGLIGTLGTILAPIIAVYVKKRVENRDNKEISFSRRKALLGKWKGRMIHNSPLADWNSETEFGITFNPAQRTIQGQAFYKAFKSGNDVDITLSGAYKSDRYLSLEYRNSDSNVSQFGFIIVELSSNGKTISGKLLGFGPETEKLVTAELALSKVTE